MELYEEMLRSMMEKVDQGSFGSFIQCIVCKRSYKSAQTTNLKNHIEAKHIDNVRFTCSVCGGIFSSRASFRTHSRNFHKEINVVPFDVSQIDQYWSFVSFVSSLPINICHILSLLFCASFLSRSFCISAIDLAISNPMILN